MAQFYDSTLGGFIQPDIIVPAGVQGYDRYAYVNNDPTTITPNGGTFIFELRYKAWGEVRYSNGGTATNYTFTGQHSNVSTLA